jgi:hypothetical protein
MREEKNHGVCSSRITSQASILSFMRHARYILAVTLIAGALCADRAVATVESSTSSRAESARIVSLAERFARRFSNDELRRVASILQLGQCDRCTFTIEPAIAPIIDAPATHPALSPFQFRLPPPGAA